MYEKILMYMRQCFKYKGKLDSHVLLCFDIYIYIYIYIYIK